MRQNKGELYRTLENIVGPENVTDKDFILEAYSRDLSASSSKRGSFVVRTRNTQEVSMVIQLANRYAIPVYIRGGGTGHWGACLPILGGIILDTSEMNNIIEIDERNLIVRVQSGCTWYKLNRELRKKKLTLLPREMTGVAGTIGASVAKAGAGPAGCSKRGAMGLNDVLGLEVVLPTGEIVKTNPMADVAGYGLGPGLTGLYIGSTGVLGVITEVHLRVCPAPEREDYLYFTFSRYEDVEKVADMLTRPVGDELAFSFSTYHLASSLNEIRVHIWERGYSNEECEFRSKKVRKICMKVGGMEGAPKQAEIFFEKVWGKSKDYFAKGVIEYVAGWCPIYSVHKFNEAWRAIVVKKHKFRVDASLFTAWLIPRGWGFNGQFTYSEPAEWEKLREISHELAKKFVELGATPRQIGGPTVPVYLYWRDRAGGYYELIKRIKTALDPNNILNPGIMIP